MLGHLARRNRRHQGRHLFLPVAPVAAALIAVAIAATTATPARASGTAYAVETSEVGEDGGCKVESWVSWASNRDFSGTASPSCILPAIPIPTEAGLQITRSRSEGEWSTVLSPRMKFKLVPTAIGTPGFAISGQVSHDTTAGEMSQIFINGASTLRLSNVVRINLNAGALWDKVANRQYFTYGAGIDWRTPDNVYTWTAEVFGQLGSAEVASVTQPRFQTGFRYRPVDRWSLDLIYGRNITGENAHWFTVGTTLRFPTEASGGNGR